jgi:osmotically inducible protein OsmC
MAMTQSATATWQGDLTSGQGTVSSATSDFWRDVPTSWRARTEVSGEGLTSPEELLAAAHASCFSMAFSNELAKAGFVADRVEIQVDVTADKREQGWTVLGSKITARGWVPNVDEATFQAMAQKAKDGCPISRALKGNVDLSVEATLES